jgi:sigma-E factor negative regulatory protein RseC
MSDSVERHGTVVGLAHGLVHIRLDRDAACSGCGSHGSCATGSAAPKVIELAVPEHTRLGDRVSVSTPASSVALAALIGYLLPPVCLLLGAIAAASAYAGDLAAVLGAGIGLLAGLLLVRLISSGMLGRRLVSPVCHPGLPSDFRPASLLGELP